LFTEVAWQQRHRDDIKIIELIYVYAGARLRVEDLELLQLMTYILHFVTKINYKSSYAFTEIRQIISPCAHRQTAQVRAVFII